MLSIHSAASVCRPCSIRLPLILGRTSYGSCDAMSTILLHAPRPSRRLHPGRLWRPWLSALMATEYVIIPSEGWSKRKAAILGNHRVRSCEVNSKRGVGTSLSLCARAERRRESVLASHGTIKRRQAECTPLSVLRAMVRAHLIPILGPGIRSPDTLTARRATHYYSLARLEYLSKYSVRCVVA